MDGQKIIERSQLRPGRYAWLARVPFAIATLGGGAVLIAMKMIGIEQVWVTAMAVVLIIAYAAIVHWTPSLRLREDQLGDNCYYLGFLYTLGSLAFALEAFGKTGDAAEIVANFGLALFSTIIGILLRVIINQARKDVLETEHDARMELAHAVVRMRATIDDAVLALDSFCRMARQTTQEQINAAAEDAAKALQEGVTKIGETSVQVLERIDAAFEEFREHAVQLNQASSATVKAIKALVTRIEKIDAPSDLLSQRLEPALKATERTAARLNERLDQDEKMLASAAERAAALARELQIAVSGIGSAASGIGAAGASAVEASRAAEVAARSMTELAAATRAAVKEQERVADEARAGIERMIGTLLQEQETLSAEAKVSLGELTATLKAHNDGMAAELDRSRRMTGEIGNALSDLADAIVKRVA